ncbi:hypothetical protein HALLA_08205 [Halostagnicola larsenii XH-48]|uniref:DUF8107 domain-containing protein n=1 Tax=Halostagnicola larsenii XH-48 TaxID=797299 RepID=W0JJS9_9EURY|nr:hypothetical protein [Halostagnicola larsenii]AHF98848.1 hypothetical protein HALLA_08205 [Halostagnicola larsenii XH-48]
MSDSNGDRPGFREGLESSEGDPRVVAVLNAILSVGFAWLLVWGGSVVGFLEYGLTNIVLLAAGLFVFAFVMSDSSS